MLHKYFLPKINFCTPTDTSVRDGLRFEYKKAGKVLGVSVYGEGPERFAILTFADPGEAEKALTMSHNKVFFGSRVTVRPTEEEGSYFFCLFLLTVTCSVSSDEKFSLSHILASFPQLVFKSTGTVKMCIFIFCKNLSLKMFISK